MTKSVRLVIVSVVVLILSLVYVYQQFDYGNWIAGFFGSEIDKSTFTLFVINKSIRFFINDTLMIVMIWMLFLERKYVRLAIAVELAGLLVILPIYFYLKYIFEGTSEISSPLLSFLHRLVINPTLMILLIPAIFYSRNIAPSKK